MKLTTFSDYSLRVLMHVAAANGRRVTIAEVAEAFGISQAHLKKVVQFLGRNGWLENVRGRAAAWSWRVAPNPSGSAAFCA